MVQHLVDAFEETCARRVADREHELTGAVCVGGPCHRVGDVVDNCRHGIPGMCGEHEGGRQARRAPHGNLVRQAEAESAGGEKRSAEDVIGARGEPFAAAEVVEKGGPVDGGRVCVARRDAARSPFTDDAYAVCRQGYLVTTDRDDVACSHSPCVWARLRQADSGRKDKSIAGDDG